MPMLVPPDPTIPGDGIVETPTGLGAASRGGSWVVEDTPMLLCTFEYIVAISLVGWWRECATPIDMTTAP